MKRNRPFSIPAFAFSMLLAGSLFAQSADPMEERLTFLKERLDASQTHGMWWQWGWMGISAGGLGYSAALAAIKDGSERVGYVEESVKSAIGVVYLLVDPMEARHGSSKIPTEGSIAERVAVAERLLQANAERAKERTDWTMHAGNIFLNGAGLGVTLAWGDKADAWINFAAGTVAGALQIWSEPGRPLNDWSEYEARYKGAPAKHTEWRILPSHDLRGVALLCRW